MYIRKKKKKICCRYHRNENHKKTIHQVLFTSFFLLFHSHFFQKIGDEEKKLAIGQLIFQWTLGFIGRETTNYLTISLHGSDGDSKTGDRRGNL